MSCAFTTFIAILLSLSIDIECCLMNTNEIISLMSQNPDYLHDPCYSEWKAAQDSKLSEIWTRREQIEKSIADYNRKRMEYEARERSYTNTNSQVVQSKKTTGLSAMFKALGIIVGVIISICCCAACVAAIKSDDANTTTTVPENVHQSAQLTSIVATNPLGNQTTLYSSSSNDHNFTTIIVSPTSLQESSVPLMPMRQNSLPSYEDALKMPSASTSERIVGGSKSAGIAFFGSSYERVSSTFEAKTYSAHHIS